MITIWVDADSCPKSVRTYLIDYSFKLKLKINFVANKKIPCHNEHIFFSMIITDNQSQAADNYIFNNTSQYDIVITRDILLAERLVQKNIKTINDRGTYFSKENIKKKVEERNYDFNLAQLGFSGSKEKNYGMKELKKFRECFEKTLKKIYQEN